MRIIDRNSKEFATTPRDGWKNGEFYLISGGGSIKRVYDPANGDAVPEWAYSKPGAPKMNVVTCIHCGREQAETSLVNKKYCQKCGRDARKQVS